VFLAVGGISRLKCSLLALKLHLSLYSHRVAFLNDRKRTHAHSASAAWTSPRAAASGSAASGSTASRSAVSDIAFLTVEGPLSTEVWLCVLSKTPRHEKK